MPIHHSDLSLYVSCTFIGYSTCRNPLQILIRQGLWFCYWSSHFCPEKSTVYMATCWNEAIFHHPGTEVRLSGSLSCHSSKVVHWIFGKFWAGSPGPHILFTFLVPKKVLLTYFFPPMDSQIEWRKAIIVNVHVCFVALWILMECPNLQRYLLCGNWCVRRAWGSHCPPSGTIVRHMT